MKKILIVIVVALQSILNLNAKQKTDANIFGHVVSGKEHIAFVTVSIVGTTFGAVTDETGHFKMTNLPVGEYTISASAIGYKSEKKIIKLEKGKTIELIFYLEEDVMQIDEVVVSGNRNEANRTDAPTIINTILPKLFSTSTSVTIGNALSFSPGLRLENNCQNCGFNQLRMNGMEGPYSQILINSRPIFSGLAEVYGLEFIPVNMIERIEVIRGGGSALFGSNAIAGTVNLILKEPKRNTWEFGTGYALHGINVKGSGDPAPDYSVNFNTSLVFGDQRSGLTMYGFTRDKKVFDANGDGFSESMAINNLTFGSRFYYKTGIRSKLTMDFFTIKEERDGGNKFDYPKHERDIGESLTHDLKTLAFSYEQYFRDYDILSIYAAGQMLSRDSYYGAGKSLKDYGNTQQNTVNAGIQYKMVFNPKSNIVMGIENTSSTLVDKKLGYPDYDNAVIKKDSITDVPHIGNRIVSNQGSVTTGIFAQYELKISTWKFMIGGRFAHYKIDDREYVEARSTGNVFSPRISIMKEISETLKARIGYSKGYRPPQIFDEDLHIESSGSRQVIRKNSDDLIQETSHSISASLDFNGMVGKTYTGILIEGFYTGLQNPFVHDIGEPNDDGVAIYTRMNAEGGAKVQGVNIEFKARPGKKFELSSGFTAQTSKYDNPQENFNERRFFRSPELYGFFAVDWDFAKNICLSSTGNYTGKMLVPYFGTNPEKGELKTSPAFFDAAAKLAYTIDMKSFKAELYGGMKNIFNSYQSDFDTGEDRDPGYIYGPIIPRTLIFGLKIRK